MTANQILFIWALVFLICGVVELQKTLWHAKVYKYKLSIGWFVSTIYWFVAGTAFLVYIGVAA